MTKLDLIVSNLLSFGSCLEPEDAVEQRLAILSNGHIWFTEYLFEEIGMVNIFEGKLYIQTGKVKPTAKQIAANPKVEICAMVGGEWMRVSRTLVEDDCPEAKKSMLDAYPSLRKMYDENDGNMVVYYFKDATAVISAFTHEPETITFRFKF